MKTWKGYQKGINFGGWLSQCDHTKEHYETFIKEEDFKVVSDWGADHIRLPVDYNPVETLEGDYKEEGFAYIQNAIDWCEKYHLNMVLDLHKTFGYSFDAGEKEDGFFVTEAYQERFIRLWEQFATRFGKYPNRVAFELLNEVTLPEYMPTWLRVVENCIARIRRIAPEVTILVGGYWNNSVEAIKDIQLSCYENIVLNFHCYEPFLFTHQGAYWLDTMKSDFRIAFPGSLTVYADEMQTMFANMTDTFRFLTQGADSITEAYFENMFAPAIAFAEEKHVPLYCGEYGVINLADMQSTLRWYQTIMPVLKRHSIGRAVWNYKEMDFGLIDAHMQPILAEIKKEMFEKGDSVMKQIFNPFLPLHEYIPDGEPHVFGDRVYHFGSHDKEGGYTYCMLDYVCYSAPVDDLTDWRYEGVIYRANQDPQYGDKLKYMYAPDVVRGNDGKYYLYYCMSGDYGQGGYTCPICVARADSPAGKYEYLGIVHYKDGIPMMKYVCFDPAVINDDGVIRVYYGTRYDYEERDDFFEHPEYLDTEAEMFGRSKEEILSYGEDSILGPSMVVLEDDMLTVKEDAKHIIPYRVKGTSFEEHPFFEGSSMRKIGNKYYFIYSSWLNHELCYATSDYPDKDFTFGGTIVSNGDIGYQGRDANHKLNMTGTTHGSIIRIDNQWYVFYHRLTHRSDYSRQACAEKIAIEADGSIKQVEITSCGLNKGPLLAASGMTYPAVICCNLTNGNMPHGSNSILPYEFPNVTNRGEDRFIENIEDGTLIGFKYFQFHKITKLQLVARIEDEDNKARFDTPIRVDERCVDDDNYHTKGNTFDAKSDSNGVDDENYFELKLSLEDGAIGRITIDKNKSDSLQWTTYESELSTEDGVYPLYLIYHGKDKVQLKEFTFA